MALIDNIRTYTRQLVRAPTESELPNADLDFAINTTYQYDFPNDLKLINLERNIKWYCNPGVDRYELTAIPLATGPVNYIDYMVMLDRPIYIAGVLTYLSQNQQEFYNIFPKVNTIISIGGGNGTNGVFSGFLGANGGASGPTGVLRNNVIFTATSITETSLVLQDDGNGVLFGAGTGTINYFTGEYNIGFFPSVPAAGTVVYAQYVPCPLTLPFSVLYFDNGFNLRPVPDKAYAIEMQVYAQPTALSDTEQVPVLGQWWQMLSLFAARFIFSQRMDQDSIAQITPELERQRSLALSNTVNNITKLRAPTMYDGSAQNGYFGQNWNNYY